MALNRPHSDPVADWTSGEPRLVIGSCGECGHRWYLPHPWCPRCSADTVRRFPSDGGGALLAVTSVHRAPGEDGSVPFGICLVDLDQRVRVMGRCSPSAVPGQRVRVTFDTDAAVPYFHPERAAPDG